MDECGTNTLEWVMQKKDNHPLAGLSSNERRWPFILAAFVLAAVAVVTSGLVGDPAHSEYTLTKATVLMVNNSELVEDGYIEGMLIGKQPVKLQLSAGPHKGEIYEVTNMLSRAFNIYCREGMTIISNVREENGIVTGLDVFGYSRDKAIISLGALFMLVIFAVGRKKGLYSIISLAFTLTIVIFFMIPRIISGNNPILLALLTAALTSAVTIFIVGGYSAKSFAAIAGILGGVSIAGLTSWLAGLFGNINGLHVAEAAEMISLSRDMPIRVPELLCAGIIISSLGAIMDVGMSISSSIFEVRAANRSYGPKELFRSGMNVGGDVMGTMSNTLILAFAGSSLTVLIILILYNLPYLRMVNLDLLAVELVQGFAGSIGLILAVPITAACAAFGAVGAIGGKHAGNNTDAINGTVKNQETNNSRIYGVGKKQKIKQKSNK